MLENNIEKYLRTEIAKIGGKAFKFQSPGNNGVPDRIILIKSRCYFVELKKLGENLRPTQKAVKKYFKNRLGFDVYVLDSHKKVDEFIGEVLKSEY